MIATGALDRDELAARMALLATPGIASWCALDLVVRHGSAVNALKRVRAELGEKVDDALRSDVVRERVRRARAAIRSENIRVLAWDQREYPHVLRIRLQAHAPLLLFTIGNAALLDSKSVAVVGCRRATRYGLDMAEQIGAGIGRAGVCVTSGLALGIDAAAHEGALDASGQTVAVLGCGVDVIYPHQNMRLQQRIAAEALLVSELLPGTPPMQHNFPHRNRIIAALSEAVVVVEAGRKSGAVLTAGHALVQGQPVYGVPNLMNHPNYAGVHDLLSDGAKLFTGVSDVLHAVDLIPLSAEPEPTPVTPAEPPSPTGPLHARLWQSLSDDLLHIDVLAQRAAAGAGETLVALLELELDGRVEQKPGQQFRRVKPKKVEAKV